VKFSRIPAKFRLISLRRDLYRIRGEVFCDIASLFISSSIPDASFCASQSNAIFTNADFNEAMFGGDDERSAH
jgi:hypothetical protein